MTKPNVQSVSMARMTRKQMVIASVIHRCEKCGAPGFWHNTPGVNVGCYDPSKFTNPLTPVGPICPNCGADREVIQELGEIWRREFRVSLWVVIKEAIADLFKPLKRRTQ